ncbi:MAG: T9SS type A sorting domain-containing protein [Bacteroidota bacterium]
MKKVLKKYITIDIQPILCDAKAVLRGLLTIVFLLMAAFSVGQIPIGDLPIYWAPGRSNTTSINVNNAIGVSFQDIKRAAVFMCVTRTESQGGGGFSGTLINTALNCYDRDVPDKRRFYILTAEHNITIAYKNVAEVIAYISFDMEMSHATDRVGTNDQTRPVYKVNLKIVVSDASADMVLLEVMNPIDLTKDDGLNGAFYNAYAAGWQLLSLDDGGGSIANISHPKIDLKKLFDKPEKQAIHNAIQYKSKSQDGSIVPRRFDDLYLFYGPYAGGASGPEPGSSGSGWFMKYGTEYKLISVHSAPIPVPKDDNSNSAGPGAGTSALSNLWFYKDKNDVTRGGLLNNNGLIDHLDPNQTWVRKVPGGYVKDLLRIPEATDLNQALQPGLDYPAPDVSLNLQRSFVFLQKSSQPAAGNTFYPYPYLNTINGIKLTDNTGVVKKVFLKVLQPVSDTETRLLYGAMADGSGDNMAGESKFQNKPMPFADIPEEEDIINPLTNARLSSNDFKTRLLYIFSAKLKVLEKNVFPYSPEIWQKLSLATNLSTTHDTRIVLSNEGSSELKVQAVGIPGVIPSNARSIFSQTSMPHAWKSKKYRLLAGVSADNLYIDNVRITGGGMLGAFSKETSTGNNGGYLNLVNDFYKFGTITVSTAGGQQESIDFNIGVNAPAGVSYYYKVWIDYRPADEEVVEGDPYYTFTSPLAPSKLIMEGSSTGNSIAFNHLIPDDAALQMVPGTTRLCRLRIAISATNDIPAAGYGSFPSGEVEDYLIKLVAPADPRGVKRKAEDFIPVGGDADEVCDLGSPDPPPGSENKQVDVYDATAPAACNIYTSETDAGKKAALNSTSPIIGNYSIQLDGANYIKIDNGHSFIQNSFTQRTVSFWLDNDESHAGNEILYDEGGTEPGGGLGIRIIDNGPAAPVQSLEVGVKVDGLPLETLVAEMDDRIIDPSHPHRVLVTLVFDKGHLALYQNGTLSAEKYVPFEEVGFHQGEAAFGGTNGTNVFGSTDAGYTGSADDILIYSSALSEEDIVALAEEYPTYHTMLQNRLVSNELAARLLPVSPLPSATGSADLVLYPNPVKGNGDITIMAEIRQPGRVSVQIIDMQGRVACERNFSGVGGGYQQIALRNVSLKAATYIVKVMTRAHVQTGKLVVEE